MKHRLIVADDHQVVRQGLRDIFSRTPDLEVVAEAADGGEAERLAREVAADLLLLDVSMPGRRGVQVLESLRAAGIALPVLLFSMYPASQYVDYARRAGAQGFVGKDEDATALLRAIRRVLTGGTAFPGRQGAGHGGRGGTDPADPFAVLSRREAEVLRGLLRGDSLVDIAARLGIGAKSVTTYRHRLLQKLGVKSNAELAALAARHGVA